MSDQLPKDAALYCDLCGHQKVDHAKGERCPDCGACLVISPEGVALECVRCKYVLASG